MIGHSISYLNEVMTDGLNHEQMLIRIDLTTYEKMNKLERSVFFEELFTDMFNALLEYEKII